MTAWEARGGFHENGKHPRYDNAVEHWRRWPDDFELLKALNVNAYRFSMEWARIQPTPGQVDPTALDQYERMIDRLLELQITPMLTLHHFTHPEWFHKTSPWHERRSVETFCEFANKIVERVADRISLFVTFNEPLVWALAAYGDAKFPPGEKDFDKLFLAVHNMMLAHAETYDLIKSKNPEASVGIAKNFVIFKALRAWNLLDHGLVYLCDGFYNQLLLRAFQRNRLRFHFPFLVNYAAPIALEDRIDFWGVNYYYRLRLRFKMKMNDPISMSFQETSDEGISDLGWEVYSRGLWDVLNLVRSTGKPIYITENGIADADDRLRQQFLSKHLSVVQRAIKKGIPVKGYFHWSLMDNYEWLEGRHARFGLYAVDYSDNKRRLLRDSGRWYADFISKRV